MDNSIGKGKSMCIRKLEFVNEVVATIACGKLCGYPYARLGSAVVVGCTIYNHKHVVNVCYTFNGYFSDVTDFDKGCLPVTG